MNDSEDSPNPQPDSPSTAAAHRPLFMRVFLGDQGLRAGWRFLLYVAAVVVLLRLSVLAIHALFGAKPGIGTPVVAIATELFTFVSAAIPALVAARLEQRPWGAYGLPLRKGAGRHFLAGLAVGFVALSAVLLMIHWAHGVSLARSGFHGGDLARYAVLWGVAFLLVGFAEEFLFRGYAQFTFAVGTNFWFAGVVLSALFGAVHLGNRGEDWLGALNAALVALIFLFSLWRTGSLWFAIGAHAAWDWAESFFYGVPDSGTRSVGTLFTPHFAGSHWITGGSVGPEGSVFALLALAFIALCVQVLYPRRQWQPR